MAHRVCDDVLVRGEWRSKVREDDDGDGVVSMLRRHGGVSAGEAVRAVLGEMEKQSE